MNFQKLYKIIQQYNILQQLDLKVKRIIYILFEKVIDSDALCKLTDL